jgi:hypothetical protein
MPGEMGVSSNGTVYFVDAMNNRVRSVSPDGIITTVAGDGTSGNSGDGGPATQAEIDPSGLAVSPNGTLYIGSGSDIRVVDSDGTIHTLVAGGPPYGNDITVNGTTEAFYPESMALDGAGNLIVFSFSPKLLLEVTPSGVISEVGNGQYYATALAPTPDGSVLVANHGPGLDRVSGNILAPAFGKAELAVAGETYGLVANGVAQAPDGTVYADSNANGGLASDTGLYAISPTGVVRPLAVTNPVVATLPGPAAPGFPADLYPAPTPARAGGALTQCPSTTGLVPYDSSARLAARTVALNWGSTFNQELQASDRSSWSTLATDFTFTDPAGRGDIVSMTPASGDLYAPVVARDCGRTLVKDSLVIVIGPGQVHNAVEHLYLLDRGGTPLVYYHYF